MDIGSEIISAAAVLGKIGQEEPTQATPKRRDKKSLPMPPPLVRVGQNTAGNEEAS
jgi:hypothetical protein